METKEVQKKVKIFGYRIIKIESLTNLEIYKLYLINITQI